MVHVLVNVGFEAPVRRLIARWDRALVPDVDVVSYQAAVAKRALPAGTYVFADLDRLPAGDEPDVHALWDRLHESGRARLLNDPRRVRLRYALLRQLFEQGLSDFNVHRVGDDWPNVRFPVFVRCEHDHGGPRTSLLETPEALRTALTRLRARRAWRSQLLVTEYAAASDADGLFRKYGALRIGDRIVPWHLIASRTWLVKGTSRVSDDRLRHEERAYIDGNPHADRLRQIFDMAHIDYGRIDYGFVDGRLQVYEINTNPAIAGTGRRRRPGRQAKPAHLVRQVIDAFRDLAGADTGPPRTTIAMAPRRGPVAGWVYRTVRRAQSLRALYAHRSGVR